MPTAEEIRAARLVLNESQAKFAARFGVNQATVCRWEIKGAPKSGTARVAILNLLDQMHPKPRELSQ